MLDALDAVGLRGDGRLLQLNSFENRVFQVFLEDGTSVVVKFYRPGRWSDAQILEEHGFARELADAEVPVVAPTPLVSGGTLAHCRIDGEPFRFAVYPLRSGHGPELDDPATLRWLGRFIGRLHAVGECRLFESRRTLEPQTFGLTARERVLALDLVPPAQAPAWQELSARALEQVQAAFDAAAPRPIRLHGDCHPGNILWRDDGPQVVDLDDACNGPAMQDLWMFLSGSRAAMAAQLTEVLAGYGQFVDLDRRELALVEPLRTLRMIHHSAWLAERWTDPAFPAAFPWFGTPNYWSQQVAQLREQLEAMAEPPPDPDRLA